MCLAAALPSTSLRCPQTDLLLGGVCHGVPLLLVPANGERARGCSVPALHPCLAQPLALWDMWGWGDACSIAALAVAVGELGSGLSPSTVPCRPGGQLTHPAVQHCSRSGRFGGPSVFRCGLRDPPPWQRLTVLP